ARPSGPNYGSRHRNPGSEAPVPSAPSRTRNGGERTPPSPTLPARDAPSLGRVNITISAGFWDPQLLYAQPTDIPKTISAPARDWHPGARAYPPRKQDKGNLPDGYPKP